MRTNLLWGDEELKYLSKLYKEKKTVKEIAPLINQKFHHGDNARTEGAINHGLNLAKKKGLLVRNYSDKKWSEEELYRLNELYFQNNSMTYQEMVEILNDEFHPVSRKRKPKQITHGINLIFKNGIR